MKHLVKRYFAVLAEAQRMSSEFDRLIGERVRLVELPQGGCHGFVVDVWECPNLENSTVCFKSMPIFFALQGLCGLVLRFPSRGLFFGVACWVSLSGILIDPVMDFGQCLIRSCL